MTGRTRTGDEEYDELSRLAAEASPDTAAAPLATRDLLAGGLAGNRALGHVSDDELWLLGAYLRGRLTRTSAPGSPGS